MAECQCFKGGVLRYPINLKKACHHAFSSHTQHFCNIFSYHKQHVAVPSAVSHRYCHLVFVPRRNSEGHYMQSGSTSFGWRGSYVYNHRKTCWRRSQAHAELDVANAIDVINDLGFDTLTFLAVTVLIVPAFKIIKASPILGFFCAGVVLNQFGLIRNLTDVKLLSEWGILFLLFEMGLELSLARLGALAKFAFGMGLTQVVLSTLAFTSFELPPNGAIGTKVLEFLFHSRPDLILMSLPKEWEANVTAIQEAKDFTKLSLEELMGLLMIVELNMAQKEEEEEPRKMKTIAFKSIAQYKKR